MSPTDRLLVGRPSIYPADTTLRASLPELQRSQSVRRKTAWDIARRVLQPIKVDGGTRTLPRFQTWYSKDEVLPVFDHILKGQSPMDRLKMKPPTSAQIEEAFAWEADRAKGTAAGSDDVLAARRAQLDTNGDAALGGPERVLMSPDLVGHLYANYDKILGCMGHFPAADDAPPSDTNFAPCVGVEFPEGAVVVKARWIPDSLPLDAWDTSAAALTTALTAGDWGTAPRTASPGPNSIYTMTLPNGIRMRLAALHIMSKELRDWAWISLFWSDTPNTDFGADRPADLGGELATPFANYKMCSTVAFDEQDDGASDASGDPSLAAAFAATRAFGPRSWCSNPYLEQGAHNATTNCIGCHQHAGTDLTTTTIIDGDAPFPDGARAEARKNFPADYTFVTSTGLELASLMKAKVDQLMPQKPRVTF